MPEHLTTTCSDDMSGHLIGINGLAHKVQAATQENLQIVVAERQSFEDEGNLITDEHKKHLLTAETAEKLIEHFFGSQKQPENTDKEIPMIPTSIPTQPSSERNERNETIGQVSGVIIDGITDWKSLIYKLVAVVAGIGGFGILLVLLTYEELIQAITILTKLKPEQITFLLNNIIVLAFFVAILAIYAQITKPKPVTPDSLEYSAQPFRNVLGFIFLVVIILLWKDNPFLLTDKKAPFLPENNEVIPSSSKSPPSPVPTCLENYWCSTTINPLPLSMSRQDLRKLRRIH
ncbi:MAG: hypothetical protein DRR19_00890 [Candidatus Parabeggiatoa sp. nov. 1]|nr:MAG: hypothetical protein DRR19_00890 [Gammaproteobacteria bacterium]